jgi:hypothetical protein
VKRLLFGSEEGFDILDLPDHATLKSFGITESTQLNEIQSQMMPYVHNSNLSSTNTDWGNMIVLMNVLQASGITSANWKTFLPVMTDFGAITVDMWKDILQQMSKLKITKYPDAEGFLKKLTSFGVRYRHNFNEFIHVIDTFGGFPTLPIFHLFIDDLITLGYNFENNSNEITIIVNYFVKMKMKFIQYTKNSYSQKLLMGLHSFSSQTTYCANKINDILKHEQYNLVETDTEKSVSAIIDLIENKPFSVIIMNKNEILCFFKEKEEFDKIVNHESFTEAEIVDIMKSISGGMLNYMNSLTSEQKDKNRELSFLQLLTKQFPFAIFQYIAMNIQTNPYDSHSPNRVAVLTNGSITRAYFRK